MKIIRQNENKQWVLGQALQNIEPETFSIPPIPSIPPVSFPDFDIYNLDTGALKVEVNRYPNTRFWQVIVNGQLLAVVVYRKGALAIKETIEKLAKGMDREGRMKRIF